MSEAEAILFSIAQTRQSTAPSVRLAVAGLRWQHAVTGGLCCSLSRDEKATDDVAICLSSLPGPHSGVHNNAPSSRRSSRENMMPCSIRYGFAILLLFFSGALLSAQTKTAETAVLAVVESSLKTDGKQIRQFAFDGDGETYFASKNNPSKDDHFTLKFDRPVAVKTVEVTTGNPKGGDTLEAGILEVSEDGKKFTELAKFKDGKASVKVDGKKILSLRIKPTEDMKHPLAIREIVVDSEAEGGDIQASDRIRCGCERRAGDEGVGREGGAGLRTAVSDDLRGIAQRWLQTVDGDFDDLEKQL